MKTNFKPKMVVLNPTSMIEGLSHSPIVTGIKYGKKFLADTQEDDAWVNGSIDEVTGSQGHAICEVVVNTNDDCLVKLANTYEGKLRNNVF